MTTRTCPRPISAQTLEQAANMLRVLAHPQRLRMVELLMQRAVPVGELARTLGLPAAAVSQHLAHMRTSGIVQRQRLGRHVHYRVVDPNAMTLIECLRRSARGPSAARSPRAEREQT
jgi:DNA-binding transcriptional ArsR family regulator